MDVEAAQLLQLIHDIANEGISCSLTTFKTSLREQDKYVELKMLDFHQTLRLLQMLVKSRNVVTRIEVDRNNESVDTIYSVSSLTLTSMHLQLYKDRNYTTNYRK